MLKRRTIWLLAAVMALGCASVVPGVRADRGAGVCVIASCADEHCEQQLMPCRQKRQAEAADAPLVSHAQRSQAKRIQWPASYQRPPTRTL